MLRVASALAVLLSPLLPIFAEAAPRPLQPGGFLPAAIARAPAAGQGIGRRDIRLARRIGLHHRHGRRFVAGGYYPPAWMFPPPAVETAAPQDMDGSDQRAVDRGSFEHMPVTIGIPRAPEARPVIYRVEGTRARPEVRVLRVGIEDRRAGHRHRASAEGGIAEILTLAPR